MSGLRRIASVALILAIAGALIYVGWVTLDESAQLTCSVCGRPVHLASRVEGVAAGESLTFCCAACALRAKEQDVPDLTTTRLFDYHTGQALSPGAATMVVGSDVNLCMREHVLMDAQKEASELHFDRCSPSVLAFASKQAAERFRDEHGGSVKTFSELTALFE